MCGKHLEKRVPILYSCEVVKKLICKLLVILREANLLKRGTCIEVFLFKEYDFNSIENLALVTLWDFVYKARVDPDRYSTCKYTGYLQWNIDCLALLAPNLKLGSLAVSNIPEKS